MALIKNSTQDSAICQNFSPELHSITADRRAEQLSSSLTDKFLLAGKNDKDQTIFQNLFDELPEICKDKEVWCWVTQLPEWKAFIDPPGRDNEEEFANLLKAFFKRKRVKNVLGGRGKKMYVFSGSLPVDTSFHEFDRGGKGNDLKPDVFSTIRPPQSPQVIWHKADVDNRHGWRDVEVLWELKKNKKEITSREHISALALKAAEIMRVQWARKFVIAVFACGSLWRLCWFDRAGGVTHTHFDIESNPEWFACSVLFPLLLPKSELGVAESLSIKVEDQEFILGETLFRPRTDHLIGRGTFVRKARRPNDDENSWPLCVKLSWRSEGRVAEKTALLALRHLPGVVKLVAGRDEVDISHCRRNMPMERTVIFQRPKRRHTGSHYSTSSTKAPRVDGSLVVRSRTLEGSHSLGGSHTLESHASEGVTQLNTSSYNKILEVLVLEIAGRRYDDPRNTPLEKMICLRDVSRTLREARKAGWLHRDISPANITISGNTEPAGTVIDWGMARNIHGSDGNAQERTGTIWYMAVHILDSPVTNPPVHHVLHDLESVFWVGLLDGLQRSQTTQADAWLQDLYSITSNLHIIGNVKANAFRSPRLEMLKDHFSEPYSIMWQLLHDFILRVFDGAPDPEGQYYYGAQHDHEKIFKDVDKLFGTFIPLEQERSSAAARAETDTEASVAGSPAPEQSSEYNAIENSKSVRRSARIAKAKT